MSIIGSIVWGIITAMVMLITIKYYLPRLSKRVHMQDAEALVQSDKFERHHEESVNYGKQYNSVLLNKRVISIVLIVICALFSSWCGYIASIHAVSVISLIKMTLTMCVLSCVFITDMEFMMIPNLCSIILVVSRVITFIFEIIFCKEEAFTWLLNSALAMITSFLLLIVMSKVTHGGLGMGDIKLFSSLGFLCGVRAVSFTLMFSFLLCALTSTIFLITKKKKMKDSLPLGPFIWGGYGITVLLSIM